MENDMDPLKIEKNGGVIGGLISFLLTLVIEVETSVLFPEL